MSAKKAKKLPSPSGSAARNPALQPSEAVAADGDESALRNEKSAGDAVAVGTEASSASWLESSDPQKRQIARIALVGLWVYVAALWLLALDQTFDWGIFGPKVPPAP